MKHQQSTEVKEALTNAFAKRKTTEAKKEETAKAAKNHDRTPFIERFGEEQLKNHKLTFGNRDLIYLKVEDKLAILRPPTAEDLGDYVTAIGMEGMAKAVASVMETLWIDGDIELIDDEDLFIACFLQMNNILESKKGEFFRA